jgi:branched-chain amino acid transport system permease protein
MIQVLVNATIDGLAIGILALCFGLIYNTLRVFHFAFASFYVLAAYAYLAGLGWLGLLFCVLLVYAVEAVVYYPLFRRRASFAASFISSLGVHIILINSIVLFFGSDTRMVGPGIRPNYDIGPIILTDIQLWLLLYSLIVCVAMMLLLNRTSVGNSLLAVGENLLLLKALGGNVRMLRVLAITISTALAGVIAILRGLETGTDPFVGLGILFTSVAAFIMSGGRSYQAIIFSGLLLGLIRNLTVWFFSAQWMDASTFICLILILLVRQRGLSSMTTRLEEQ